MAQVLEEEVYVSGRLYSLGLQEVFLTPEWSVRDVTKWARPYLDLLRRHAQVEEGGGWLEGRYLDLTPFNLVFDDGRLAMIDLEWKADEPLPLPYVFFRGLYHTFSRVAFVLTPAAGTPLNILGLCMAVAGELGFDVSGMLERFMELEGRYFGAVFSGGSPGDGDLVVTGPGASTVTAVPASTRPDARMRLYPLLHLHLQVFVETETRGFCEEASTWRSIGLTPEPKVHSILLPHFTADTVRLRIDPSDHNGLIRLHAIDLRTADGMELFHWTPYSRCDAEMSGMMILNAGPRLPDPVMLLTSCDPMLILSLPAGTGERAMGPVRLELEVSALPPELFDPVGEILRDLARFVS